PFHSVSKGDIAQSGGQWRGRDRGGAPHATPSQKLPEKAGNTLMIIGYNTPFLITNWPKQCGF
uniref:hypothetical protein n=1 Tax=Alteromonas australica TaxID=589873 RepID=UPI00249141A8